MEEITVMSAITGTRIIDESDEELVPDITDIVDLMNYSTGQLIGIRGILLKDVISGSSFLVDRTGDDSAFRVSVSKLPSNNTFKAGTGISMVTTVHKHDVTRLEYHSELVKDEQPGDGHITLMRPDTYRVLHVVKTPSGTQSQPSSMDEDYYDMTPRSSKPAKMRRLGSSSKKSTGIESDSDSSVNSYKLDFEYFEKDEARKRKKENDEKKAKDEEKEKRDKMKQEEKERRDKKKQEEKERRDKKKEEEKERKEEEAAESREDELDEVEDGEEEEKSMSQQAALTEITGNPSPTHSQNLCLSTGLLRTGTLSSRVQTSMTSKQYAVRELAKPKHEGPSKLKELLKQVNAQADIIIDSDGIRALEDLRDLKDPEKETRCTNWVSDEISPMNWPVSINWHVPPDFQTSLTSYVPELIHGLNQAPVVIIRSPTGSGKTVTAAELAVKFAQNGIEQGTLMNGRNPVTKEDGLKIVHFAPTGEIVRQNFDHTSKVMQNTCGLKMGYYSSSLNETGQFSCKLKKETNYLNVTNFFGKQLLTSTAQFIHVAIVDEVHDLSGPLVQILYLLQIGVVVLMSATLSDPTVHDLRTFFRVVGSQFFQAGRTPMSIDMHSLSGADEQRALTTRYVDEQRRKIPCDRQSLAHQENVRTRIDGPTALLKEFQKVKPDMKIMRRRVAAILQQHIMDLIDSNQDIEDHDFLLTSGWMIFCPSNSDVVSMRSDLNRFLGSLPQNNPRAQAVRTKIKSIMISGESRDPPFLRNQIADDVDNIQIVFCTSLLATGITPIGIGHILDTGAQKNVTIPNREGVEELILMWCDVNSFLQRKGRVGRVENGHYHCCFSDEELDRITHRDYTDYNLDTKWKSTDLDFLLNHHTGAESLVPSKEVLLTITGTQGFFREDPWTQFPRLNGMGVAICRTYHNIGLDDGLFLTIASKGKCLLHALALVASALANHSAIRAPSNELKPKSTSTTKATATPGRSDSKYSLNWWPEIIDFNFKSDMMVYTDLLVNLLLTVYGQNRGRTYKSTLPLIDSTISKFYSKEGLDEATSSLRIIRMSTPQDIEFKNYKFKTCQFREFVFLQSKSIRQGRTTWRMARPYQSVQSFNAKNFSSNDVDEEQAYPEDAGTGIHNPPTRSNTAMDRHARLNNIHNVIGERDVVDKPDCLAVYRTIFHHSNSEMFFTALIHQTDSTRFLLFGYAFASHLDQTNRGSNGYYHLAIRTNTYTFIYDFVDLKLRMLIHEFREKLALVPYASFVGSRLAELFMLYASDLENSARSWLDVQPTGVSLAAASVNKPIDNHLEFLPKGYQ